MPEEIVPFGKHKGKPIEAILDDRKYRDWLLAQSWFKEQHTSLYTVVINNGTEPVDTPEHNAMQIRFLDEGFRLKFAMAAKGESIFEFTTNEAVKTASARVAQIRESVISEFEERIEASFNSDMAYYQERIERYQKELNQCDKCEGVARNDCYHSRPDMPIRSVHSVPEVSIYGVHEKRAEGRWQGTNKLLSCSRPEFEANGADVDFTVTTGFSFSPSELKLCGQIGFEYGTKTVPLPNHVMEHRFTIEIKPSVGDDYPSVFRQMKHNKSNHLLLRVYNGVGATEDQFKDFFKTQGIEVVFEKDVDAITLPAFNAEINQA